MTQLVLIDNVAGSLWPQGADGAPAAAGSCARCPIGGHHGIAGRGPCWMVRLPGDGGWWHTNVMSTDDPRAYWAVSGEAPNLTVTPSINVGPEWWHGFITAGVLAPDADHNGDAGPHPVSAWRRIHWADGHVSSISPGLR